MVVLVVLVMVIVFTAPSEGCVNSCCQTCQPDQCEVCYKLNNNPIMCPCIGEIGVTSSSVLVMHFRDNSNLVLFLFRIKPNKALSLAVRPRYKVISPGFPNISFSVRNPSFHLEVSFGVTRS